jgi:predicted nucleic acid-binding protein
VVSPSAEDFSRAAALAERHDLTLYHAAYAAVAERSGAELATLDRALLGAGLGSRPTELVARLIDRSGGGEGRG